MHGESSDLSSVSPKDAQSSMASQSALCQIYDAIVSDPMNRDLQEKGYLPVYTAGSKARIVIIGQAPGIKAQLSNKPWNDASGATLREWLGLASEQFYDPELIALIPMDFYFPGKGAHGDLPPRKGFAEKWHPQLLAQMPHVELTILIGTHAQKHYLGKTAQKNLTETVRNYGEYLPSYLPLVHPSPLNFRWKAKNPWFDADVVPELQKNVSQIVRRDSAN